MTKKRDNFSALEHSFASSTQRQFAQLNQAIRALGDKTAGLKKSLHVPVPKGGSRYTKSVRSRPSIFQTAALDSIGGALGRGLVSGGGSFYTSAAQSGSFLSDALQTAERIL